MDPEMQSYELLMQGTISILTFIVFNLKWSWILYNLPYFFLKWVPLGEPVLFRAAHHWVTVTKICQRMWLSNKVKQPLKQVEHTEPSGRFLVFWGIHGPSGSGHHCPIQRVCFIIVSWDLGSAWHVGETPTPSLNRPSPACPLSWDWILLRKQDGHGNGVTKGTSSPLLEPDSLCTLTRNSL